MADGTKVLDPDRSRNVNSGDTINTNEITDKGSVVPAGQKVQRVQLGIGKEGEYDDLTSDNPLPVTDTANKTDDRILDAILLQIQLTNFYLAKICGETFIESDLDNPVNEGI